MSESLKAFPATHWSFMASSFVVALKKIGWSITGNEVSLAVHQKLLEYCALLEVGMRGIPGSNQLQGNMEFIRAWGILSGISTRSFETRKEVAPFLAPLIDFIRRSREPRALTNAELTTSVLLQRYFTKLGQLAESGK